MSNTIESMDKSNLTSMDAYNAYQNGDYYKALMLYSKLANKIGHNLFYANIALCLLRLNANYSGYARSIMGAVRSKKFNLLREFFSEDVIVSVTSFPARISTVHVTIKSLLEQSFKPHKLILWLAKEQFPSREKALPTDLLRLKEFGLEIEWCNDIKSYKKLVPSLLKYPDNVIVTADDDVIYEEDWLLQLVVTHIVNPSHIICHRAHRASLDKENNIINYRSWSQDIKCTNPSYSTFFTGCGGVLYPPKSLLNIVTDANLFTKICPHGDDIWFWGMAVLNGTKIQRVMDSNFQLNQTPDTQESALWIRNVSQDGNDVMLKALLKNYPEIGKALQNEISHSENNGVQVSIIVPVYNTGQFLSACLDSLIKQSLKNIEVLCVDDGSSDSVTLGILQEYSERYDFVRTIRQTNDGPATARNNGLKHAKGEYIAFIDSDDYISDDYIENLYKCAIKNNVDISIANQITCVDDFKHLNIKKSGYEGFGEISTKTLAAEAMVITGASWNKLYRKQFLLANDICYLDGMRCIAEDNYFSIIAMVLAHNSFYVADNTTYFYRQHEMAITKNVSLQSLYDSIHVYESIKKRIGEIGAEDQVYWQNIVNKRALRDLRYNARMLPDSSEFKVTLSEKFKSNVDVCCIADEGYVTPTLVFLESIRRTKSNMTCLSVTVLIPLGSKAKMAAVEWLSTADFIVKLVEIDVAQFETLHEYSEEDNFCMASPTAMIKFIIPNIFSDLDRILYIDADLIVRKDLLDLYMTSMDDEYLCAVVDMWAPITDREFVKKCQHYFNSGMMLMNLAKMRKDNVPQELIEAKLRSTNFDLMDQDVFNEVCDGHIQTMDIKYNFLPICYKRHHKKFDLKVINRLYNSSYLNIEETAIDPVIVHWAGSDKPWKTSDTLFSDEWKNIHHELANKGFLEHKTSSSIL